jgi:hypothetical protein
LSRSEKVKNFYHTQAAHGQSPRDLLASLRHFHDSLDENERRDALELLGSMGTSDSARELTHLFETCAWRTTRFEILRYLSRHPFQRTLEFLFRIARDPADLPMAEAALETIGSTRLALGARFLTQSLTRVPESLRPAVIRGIALSGDLTLAHDLVRDIGSIAEIPQLKSLVLAAGELKLRAAEPVLLRLAQSRTEPSLSLGFRGTPRSSNHSNRSTPRMRSNIRFSRPRFLKFDFVPPGRSRTTFKNGLSPQVLTPLFHSN